MLRFNEARNEATGRAEQMGRGIDTRAAIVGSGQGGWMDDLEQGETTPDNVAESGVLSAAHTSRGPTIFFCAYAWDARCAARKAEADMRTVVYQAQHWHL